MFRKCYTLCKACQDGTWLCSGLVGICVWPDVLNSNISLRYAGIVPDSMLGWALIITLEPILESAHCHFIMRKKCKHSQNRTTADWQTGRSCISFSSLALLGTSTFCTVDTSSFFLKGLAPVKSFFVVVVLSEIILKWSVTGNNTEREVKCWWVRSIKACQLDPKLQYRTVACHHEATRTSHRIGFKTTWFICHYEHTNTHTT